MSSSSTAAQRILAAKQAGNACVQRDDYEQALIEYTKGITTTPPAERTSANSFHLLYGNRSFCYFQSQEYEAAYEDAVRALGINSNYGKGYYRMGLAARELQHSPEVVALYFEDCKRLDPSMLSECDKNIRELSVIHSNLIFLEMLSVNNAFSLFRQVWFDFKLRDKIKVHLDAKFPPSTTTTTDDKTFEMYLKTIVSAALNSTENDNPNAARADSIVDNLIPEWNDAYHSVESMMNVLELIMSLSNTAFDMLHHFIVRIQKKIKSCVRSMMNTTKRSKGTSEKKKNEGLNEWLLSVTDRDEFEHLIGDHSKGGARMNVQAAREHFQKFQIALSISGKLFRAHGEVQRDRLALMRQLEEEYLFVPNKNQRLALRTTQTLIFKILLPLFENWMNEIYPTEEKRAELPKNIVDHFFNYKKIHPTASSLQSLLQDDGGVCACCLEPFIADKKTKSHYNTIYCAYCNSVFFCSVACRNTAHDIYQHNSENGRVACCGKIGKLVERWLKDSFENSIREIVTLRPTSKPKQPRQLRGLEKSEKKASFAPQRKPELIPRSTVCTPKNVDMFFKPASGDRIRSTPKYKKWVKIINSCTNAKINNADPYGDGDQSPVPGKFPGTPAGDLHDCWDSRLDFDSDLISQFALVCYEGYFDAVSAALAALPDDEARRKAVNRRESLMRVSPLMVLACGSFAVDDEHASQPTVDYLRTAKLVVDCGADLNARDILGVSVVSWFCAPAGHPRTQPILIGLCETFTDRIKMDTVSRVGSWAIFNPCGEDRFDTFRTMLMLGANPFRLDRNTGFMGIDPRFLNPKFHEIAMKCYRNRNLRLDDLVSLHSLKNAKHLNGGVGKIVERLPEGKYAVEIPDDKKKVSIAMENVIAAGECPNCDKPALLNELLCSTCRLGFCCQECLKSHAWCEDAEDATHLDVPDDCFVTLSLEKDYKRKVSMKLSDAQPVPTATKPRPNHFFMLKVAVPIKGSEAEELFPYGSLQKKYTFKPPEKNVFLYDATHTFKYVLDKEKQKRLGGAAQAQAYDTLLAATDEYPAAFFWAVLDEAESQIKIDIKAKTPTVLW